LASVPGTQKWAFTTGGKISFSSTAVGADGTVYVGSEDGSLYAVNPNGTPKWAFNSGGAIVSSPAIAADGTVYVGSFDGNLYAVRPNGTQKWVFYAHPFVSSPAVGIDGTVFVGSGPLYAVNPEGTYKWAFNTGSTFTSSPAIAADGTIYVGSWDGKLYAVRPNGTQKWAYPIGPPTNAVDYIGSSPAIGLDGTVYMGSWDGNLYAVNPDGTLKWIFGIGKEISSSPVISADGTIYVASANYGLHAVNPDGTQKWVSNLGYNAAVGSDGTIYAVDDYLHLNALTPDGAKKWTFLGNGFTAPPTLDAEGTIYVGGSDGNLYAVYTDSPGPAKSSWPMFHHDVRHTGRYGYIPPPPVPYLYFNPISSPQTIGSPFSVTITARQVDGSLDTSFNGEVILSSSVPVGTSFVYLSNGVWNGQVNVLGDGSNLVLQATGGGQSGTSNPFSTAGAATVSGNLSGVVTNDASNSVPIAGATVHLSLAANGPDAYPPQTTDASGRYAFSGVASGDNYYLWATKLGATSPSSYRVAIPAWGIARNLQIPTA